MLRFPPVSIRGQTVVPLTAEQVIFTVPTISEKPDLTPIQDALLHEEMQEYGERSLALQRLMIIRRTGWPG
jgi:hypothetical protein